MLNLKELRFSGIGRFVEEQVIDFTKLGNLVQVDGNYVDTGGSSGAGKTTVFNALDFLLGLNDTPNSVLQSRLTDKTISVQGTFDYDGKPLIVARSKKLSITLDGEVTTGSSKLTEEKLDQILAMPRDIFRVILHKRQKEGGFFLKFTPREMNDFLVSCLNLNEEKKKIEKVDSKLEELLKRKFTAKSSYDAAQSGLIATQNALGSLGLPPVNDMDQATIDALKAKAEASRAAYEAAEEAYRSESASLEANRPQVTVVPYDRSKIEMYEKGIVAIRKKSQELVKNENDRQAAVNKSISDLRVKKANLTNAIALAESAKNSATQAALEVRKIRQSICPTCEQGWSTESAKLRESDLMAKIKTLKETVDTGVQSAERLTELLSDLALLTEQAKPLQPLGISELLNKETEINSLITDEKQAETAHNRHQNQNNKLSLDMFSFQQTQLRMRHSSLIQAANNEYSVNDKAHAAAFVKQRSYENAYERYCASLDSLKAQEQSYSKKLVELTDLNRTIDFEISILSDLNRAIKTYISCSFDDALESIGDSATKIIRNIPNMANATIQLTGVKETKDGKIKEEVNAVIHMDGDEAVPIKSLCGGEGSSVDLAVDLAVIDLVENKTNKGINVFVLDEPFTGLDTVCIEMALEVLKNSNINKKLIIVDHNPEVKQMVESRLIVVRQGTTSNLQSFGDN